MATKKIYIGDPWKELDRRVWVNISSGPISIMNMDKRIYKGVTFRIYKGGRGRDSKQHYSFWVKRKSFSEKGHRFL